MDCKIQRVSDFGAEIAKFGGTAYVEASALPSNPAFPPVLSPGRVTIVTKFFCTDTEPQHGPHIFGGGWRRVLTWDSYPDSHYGHQDDRRAHHREHFAVIETSSASFADGRTVQDWGQVRS